MPLIGVVIGMQVGKNMPFIFKVNLLYSAVFGFALLAGAVLHMFIPSDSAFLPPEKFTYSFVCVCIVLSFLATFLWLIFKVKNRAQAEWFWVISSFPVHLLGSMFLWFFAMGFMQVYTTFTSQQAETSVIVIGSKHVNERSCKYRNSFYLSGREPNSHWCSTTPVQKGKYKANAHSSSLGIVLLNLPGKKELNNGK